jgi:hypothetical protein
VYSATFNNLANGGQSMRIVVGCNSTAQTGFVYFDNLTVTGTP